MFIITKGFLLFNTVKYLKPRQFVNQILIRFRPKEQFKKYYKKNVKFSNYNLWVNELDGDREFIERFKPDELIKNKLTLLNETRNFDNWHFVAASHLWRFNVHYLEYLVALKAKYKETGNEEYKKKINEILDSWYIKGIFDSDSNQAYTISIRIVNLLLISDVVDDKQKLYDYIYAQYRFLIKHQETHLLGNHYLENLKTIVICSVIFNDDGVYQKFIKKLNKELDEEITADGLHFELSLMYHKIVMEDLIRVSLVLKEAKKSDYQSIIQKMRNMVTALYSLEGGLSRTLLFNDAGDGVAKNTEILLKSCSNLFGIEPEKKRSISGYYRISDGKITVVMDCGEMASSYMTGHSHCDCLSFEVFYDGKPVIVNSGTFQYQSKHREYFRSTAAHNTVVINGYEQSEIWGEHRTGRRIKKIKAAGSGNSITGEYKNYRNNLHRRKLTLENGMIEVIDEVKGNTKSYLHLAPGYEYKEGVICCGDMYVKLTSINADISVEESMYSPEFGVKEKNKCLVFSWNNDGKRHGYRIKIKEINEND